MSRASSLMPAILLVLAPWTLAQAQEAKEIIARAVKAHGGEETLSKYPAGKAKGKGIFHGRGLTFTQESAYMMPDKMKEVVELEAMGQKVRQTAILIGSEGVLDVNGMERKLEGLLLESLKAAAHAARLSRLLPLLKDSSYQLTALGESKLDDKVLVGVRVSAKDQRDVSLFFNKETGLLAKIERRGIDPTTKKEYEEERRITDYQVIDGLPTPKKTVILRDGQKFMELEVLEVKYHEKLADSEFKK